ncbi:MAG TPA: adenylate/guanylate cyclase domain-containing protein [Actinomycetota bacterium]
MLPSGTVTFLFTDLEGSTRAWEAHPQAMERAVPRHDEILRKTIESAGGSIFKHTGDGICAAFDSPPAAIDAAIGAQLALAAEPWPEDLDEPLRARMGIHTGTAREQNGDYFGPALNRVARLMSIGHGGQVLISSATERLASEGLPEGVTLRDLGTHRLRDLASVEQVFQVCHPDLPESFPPVRTADARPGNLPLQVTSFVGRDAQLRDLATATGDSRLITLTGVGGVGKTRLATQVAAEILPRFVDGAWLVELAPVGDPDAVPHAVMRVLGAQEIPDRSLADSIVDVLRPRTLLLILDNCEHLLVAAGALAEKIVRACPGVTIIATSREPLAVEGERVWPVTSLAIPQRDDAIDAAAAATIASISLFADRALAARPDFEVTEENAAAIGEICRRLDGVPLAIELAAARVRTAAPADIAARLDERFRLLRSGRRTAMERHQTLRATVEWSYDLLDDDERLLFDRLSVFSGGFSLEAAEAICAEGSIDAFDVPDLVESLAEKSMVVVEEDASGMTRFSTLETLRQFGEEKLVERGEANEVGRRHAVHYADLAERSYASMWGPDELRWVLTLEAEFDNFRAANAWAATNCDLDIALGLAADLSPFASWRLLPEVYAWASGALELPGADGSRRYPDACTAAAYGAWQHGDVDRAERLAATALDRADAHTNPIRVSEAFFASAIRGFAEGVEWAADVERQGRDVALAAGALAAAAFGQGGMALLAAYGGDLERGRDIAEEAIALAEQSGNPTTRAMTRYALGEALQELDPERAARVLEEALDLARNVHARFIAGITLVSLASVTARHGDEVRALELLLQAVEEWRRRGNRSQQFVTLRNVVELFERIGRDEDAACLYAATLAVQPDWRVWGPQGERLQALDERVRARLGPAYGDAVARGSAMDYDTLVSFGRDRLRDAIAASAATE